MNADEFWKLAQSLPERTRQTEQNLVQTCLDYEWQLARKAVAELDDRVRAAAMRGQFEAEIYMAISGGSLRGMSGTQWGPKLPHFVHAELEHVWEGKTSTMRYKKKEFSVPDYAQHVFDSCTPSLNPRWEVRSNNLLVLIVSW